MTNEALINDRLTRLTPYSFVRLAELLERTAPAPGLEPVVMSVGDPQHAAPALVDRVLRATASLWNRYPPLAGTPDLRAAATRWLERRYHLPAGMVDPETDVLPVSGTREALFQAALLAVPAGRHGPVPAVCMPNPFYAAYEGAAAMAGAEPVYLDATADSAFLPDLEALSPELLNRTALFYLCSPANPQGAVADRFYLERLIGLARRHGFVLALDECYAEIYDRTPPPGGLEVAAGIDGGALDNLLVFHSLSKRSSAAGLRSGFVAGERRLIAGLRRLRGYSAAGMPLPVQAASAALWDDDAHVADNRARYRAKFDLAQSVLGAALPLRRPAGGFFLWLDIDGAGLDGEAAALRLWRDAAVRVLPGAYLTRPSADGINRGDRFIRVALVHEPATLGPALERMAGILTGPGDRR